MMVRRPAFNAPSFFIAAPGRKPTASCEINLRDCGSKSLTEDTQAILDDNDHNTAVTLPDDLLSVVRARRPGDISDPNSTSVH